MIEILEQAKQKKRNAPPIGSDDTTLIYPGVNTCVTISIIPEKIGKLFGLHLGLMMGAGKEGGKGSERSKVINETWLNVYLDELKSEVVEQGSGVMKIHVAGALAVWQYNPDAPWTLTEKTVNTWAYDWKASLKYHPFDDEKAKTVDITVTRDGVQFTPTGSGSGVEGSGKELAK